MKEVFKYKIRLNVNPGGGIKTSTGQISDAYDKDFHITLPIYVTKDLQDYVEIAIDPLRKVIDRQMVNPFFIELGFFENIESVLSGNSTSQNTVQQKSPKYGIDINR
tara:strand:+ start:914 stop:1234 length:321 start_codon:yes stop_codon:yes gene_type:complete